MTPACTGAEPSLSPRSSKHRTTWLAVGLAKQVSLRQSPLVYLFFPLSIDTNVPRLSREIPQSCWTDFAAIPSSFRRLSYIGLSCETLTPTALTFLTQNSLIISPACRISQCQSVERHVYIRDSVRLRSFFAPAGVSSSPQERRRVSVIYLLAWRGCLPSCFDVCDVRDT